MTRIRTTSAEIARCLRAFAADERGATAIEYAIIAAGVAGAIVITVNTLGVSVGNLWTSVKNALG